MKIAMWSGPRNLSTAMMYAFGNRADFHVVDEPFYGPYLRMTGLAHPMGDEIMASRPESGDEVAAQLSGPIHFHPLVNGMKKSKQFEQN